MVVIKLDNEPALSEASDPVADSLGLATIQADPQPADAAPGCPAEAPRAAEPADAGQAAQDAEPAKPCGFREPTEEELAELEAYIAMWRSKLAARAEPKYELVGRKYVVRLEHNPSPLEVVVSGDPGNSDEWWRAAAIAEYNKIRGVRETKAKYEVAGGV